MFWIHNFLTSGQVTLEHLHTDQMIADMFTKPLQRIRNYKIGQGPIWMRRISSPLVQGFEINTRSKRAD